MAPKKPQEDDLRRLRRLQKFSKEARDRIVNDPLNDRALLSRSSSSNVNELKSSSKLRGKLLNDLRSLWTQSSGENDAQVEHGLRKLREVIVSVHRQHQNDEDFIQFSFDVYELSYDFYLTKKEYRKLGNLILAFVVSELPKRLAVKYAEVYAIFLSHIERDMGKCLHFLNTWHSKAMLGDSYKRSVRMSLIFNNFAENAGMWFELLNEIPTTSMSYKFLRDSPAFVEMRDRCLATVSQCYNQISVKFLSHHWLRDFLSESELTDRFESRANSHGTEIIEFKRARR